MYTHGAIDDVKHPMAWLAVTLAGQLVAELLALSLLHRPEPQIL